MRISPFPFVLFVLAADSADDIAQRAKLAEMEAAHGEAQRFVRQQ